MAEDAQFSRVALLLPACELPGASVAELRTALQLELQGEGLLLAPPGELSSTTDVLVRIDVTCEQASGISLRAEYAGSLRERRVELDELRSEQRARALALAVAELLASLRRGADSEPAPTTDSQPVSSPSASAFGEREPPPASQSAAVPPPAAVPRPAPSGTPAPAAVQRVDRVVAEHAPLRLGIAPELRLFGASPLWGARLAAEQWPWTVSLDGLASQASAPAGNVISVVAQLNLARLTRLLGDPNSMAFEAGPRVGVGIGAFLVDAGPSARGADALDIYLDAALTTRWLLLGARRLRAGLAAEIGYARGPVGYADEREVARMYGPFVSLLVDASHAP